MSTILGRFSEYLNVKSKDSDLPEREEAIENYLSQGGLLKVDDSGGGEPKLIYPGKDRIRKQLESTKKKEKYLQGEVLKLQRKKRKKARKTSSLKKVFDPLYWEHFYKMRTNEGYKKAYEEVQPPIEKANDSDWRSMIKMFVKEPEYRERLIEAARSEISKGKGTIREEMQKREHFSEEVIDKRVKKLKDKLDKYRKKRRSLKVLLKWARE